MKVTGIALWSVGLISRETYCMAEGKTSDTVKTHVLCLETDTGPKGWGEVCPIPHYLPAFADGAGSARPGESSRGNHGSQETGIGDSPSGRGGAIAMFDDRGGEASSRCLKGPRRTNWTWRWRR